MQSERCPVARTLSVIGDRWTVLILRDAFRGAKRFEEFHGRLKCSRAIVADRLARLVEEGMLSRELYEARPPRYEYSLTEMGTSLRPTLRAMYEWGETWRPLKAVEKADA